MKLICSNHIFEPKLSNHVLQIYFDVIEKLIPCSWQGGPFEARLTRLNFHKKYFLKQNSDAPSGARLAARVYYTLIKSYVDVAFPKLLQEYLNFTLRMCHVFFLTNLNSLLNTNKHCLGFGRNHSRRTGYCAKSPGACPGPVFNGFVFCLYVSKSVGSGFDW